MVVLSLKKINVKNYRNKSEVDTYSNSMYYYQYSTVSVYDKVTK